MKWEKIPIKDICIGIYDGPHATPKTSESGPVFLGIQNFNNGRLDFSEIRHISEEDFSKWTKRVEPRANDIVFSYEATLNLYAIIPENLRCCLGRRLALIRIDETKAHYKFVYYYFQSNSWKAEIKKNTVLGATVDRIPLIKFPEFLIELPPLKFQYKIADILSQYDSLIENNQKRIKLLEEAAQRLYKEWFVKLHFPGNNNLKNKNEIPADWHREPVSHLGEFLNGFAFKPSDWSDKGKPIIKIKEMTNGVSSDTPRNKGERVPQKYLIKTGDLLFSWSATLLVMIWNEGDGWLNQHIFKVVPHNGIGKMFLMYSLKNAIAEFANLTTGSTMKHIQRNKLDQVFINVPNIEIMNHFELVVEKYEKQISILVHANQILSEARNRLLAKLMSEEVEV